MSFRDGLLDGRQVAVSEGRAPLADRLSELGADVAILPRSVGADEESAESWVQRRGALRALVQDGRDDFGAGGDDALRIALERTWISARAVATAALIPGADGGRLIFVAPRPDAGPLASAARAGLESLARTLGVEWARHRITAVTICPGPDTAEDELADVVAFLLSAAGGYFSGCRFDLGTVVAPLLPAS